MRTTKSLAIAISGCALAVVAAIPVNADAAVHSASHGQALAAKTSSCQTISKHNAKADKKAFRTTLKQCSGVKSGTTLVATGTHTLKNTKFYCVLSVLKLTKGGSIAAADAVSVVSPTSNSKGKVVCKIKYHPFTGLAGTTPHTCPLSKKDAKAHWFCAVALADQASTGAKAASYAGFSVKK
jgi:hypothetical protein